VFALPIPLFDPESSVHARVVDIATQCETAAAGVVLEARVGFQAARGRVREALGEAGLWSQLDEAVTELLALGSERLLLAAT
jgi:hypothetical protein